MEDCAYVIPRARCGFLFAGMTGLVENVLQDSLVENVLQDSPKRSSHVISVHAAQSSSAFARQDTHDSGGCSVCFAK